MEKYESSLEGLGTRELKRRANELLAIRAALIEKQKLLNGNRKLRKPKLAVRKKRVQGEQVVRAGLPTVYKNISQVFNHVEDSSEEAKIEISTPKHIPQNKQHGKKTKVKPPKRKRVTADKTAVTPTLCSPTPEINNFVVVNGGMGPIRKSASSSLPAPQTLKINKAKLAEKIKEYRRFVNVSGERESNKIHFDANDRIKLNGITYAVTEAGTKLIPLDFPKGSTLPHRDEVIWAGMKFIGRSSGILRSTNRRMKVKEQCRYYARTGYCGKATSCRYRHDPHRIRACSKYLQGTCNNANCLLSHNCNQYNTPLCHFFLSNGCTNSECRFLHHRPPHYGDPEYEVWLCRPFAIAGSCFRGLKCPLVHLPRCPDFEESGVCAKETYCQLEHTFTRRHQRLMATKDTVYVRDCNDQHDDVLVEVPPDSSDTVEVAKQEPTIISSFTISPEDLLNVKGIENYDVVVDHYSNRHELYNDNQFIIQLSELDSDDLEENTDYVGFR